jgi:chromosome segregation ATPase
MSTDRTTEILNYLSAISREVGEMRTEINGRLERIEREQRLQGQRLDRIEGMLLTMRADVGELQDRVTGLESKQA